MRLAIAAGPTSFNAVMQMAMKIPLEPVMSTWPVPTRPNLQAWSAVTAPQIMRAEKTAQEHVVGGLSSCPENDGHHNHCGGQNKHDALEPNAKGD